MFRRRGSRVRGRTPRLRCALPHTSDQRTGSGIPGLPPATWPLSCAYVASNDPVVDHDLFRSGAIQTTCSFYPADCQAHRVICTWLPPGTEPRPSWGEPPKRTPPARPTLSRRGVTTSGRPLSCAVGSEAAAGYCGTGMSQRVWQGAGWLRALVCQRCAAFRRGATGGCVTPRCGSWGLRARSLRAASPATSG
jgi:hypothetical protein